MAGENPGRSASTALSGFETQLLCDGKWTLLVTCPLIAGSALIFQVTGASQAW
jgi:hypothetical protein